MRRSVLPVIKQADLERPLLPYRLADLQHRPPVSGRALEHPAVPAEDLLTGVSGHGEEPVAGEDDGVACDTRVRDQEAALDLVEGLRDPIGVTGGERLVDEAA